MRIDRLLVRLLSVQALAFALVATPLAAQADESAAEPPAEPTAEPTVWTERTLDVAIDGVHADGARVFRHTPTDGEERIAVVPPQSGAILVLEPGGHLSALSAGALAADGPGSRTSTETPTPVGGTWSVLGDGSAFAVTDCARSTSCRGLPQALVVGRHLGPAGPLDADALWAAVPGWRELAESWSADAEGEADAVAALAAVDEPIELEVVFGTWCGDSRRSVPKLLAALERSGNTAFETRLLAVRRGFEEPLGTTTDLRVTNVPTVIVRRGGLEVGRFVERPRSSSVVTDLAAILAGRPHPAPDRFSDHDTPLASGSYRLTAPSGPGGHGGGADVGHESWSLFRTDAGDLRLGCRRVGPGGAITESWQRWSVDEDRIHQTEFVEVTRRAPGELSRTRVFRRGAQLQSLTRGDASGIVEQDQEPPAGTLVAAPCLVAEGLAWAAAGRPDELETHLLRYPPAGEGFAGRLGDLELRRLERTTVATTFGDHAADHVVTTGPEGSTEWWLHADLGVPLRVERPDQGFSARLEWLERPGDLTDSPDGDMSDATGARTMFGSP